MNKLVAALACALGALAIVGPAAAGVSVGVNDDAGKYANGDPQFWQTMKQNGLKQNAVTILWDETQPTTILDQSFLQKSLPAAKAAGIDVVFDVYPMHSQAFTKSGATPAQFGAFLKKLAQTFPQVTEYVVMNECNQTRFVNPQFDASGQNQSAGICGAALAAGYDALKSVNPSIFVWGVGLSPRGNDNAKAKSNVSTSPVNFLKALGQWYRQSGRSQPLMDGLDFHPYPIPQSLDFDKGYADKENASITNLPRVYQAFYDGFKGTPQKTIGPGGLPVSLNEVGIQTDNSGKSGYTGAENAATASGGVRGDTSTESFQSGWYLEMLNYVACDPNIRAVNIFHLVDESDLGGWQSGLYYVGYQAKQSASAVSQWIAQTGGTCSGAAKPWSPDGATGGSVAGIGTMDKALQAKFDALVSKGVFEFDNGVSGSFEGTASRANAMDLIAKLFATPDPNALGSAFDDLGAKAAAQYLKAAQSLFQTKPQPNVLTSGQAFTNLLASVFGSFTQPAQVNGALVKCTTAKCAAATFAQQATSSFCSALGLCPRSTSSAAARPAGKLVARGTANVKRGKSAKLKLRSVKGAKRAYGTYVLVLRVAPKAAGAEPAAVAVKFTIKKAKATKAKKAKQAHAKAKGHAKPKAKAKKH